MKRIQIRNVPDAIWIALKRKASDEGLSLRKYLLAHIRGLAGQPSVREVLSRAGSRGGCRLSLEEAAELIRADRDAR
jgi:hypothetical protein